MIKDIKNKSYILKSGDCLVRLKAMKANSVHAIVTDPPYGINFMGKKWDYNVPSVAIWVECLRVLKPGGYLLSFSSTRTYHRMVVNIEDAGFSIVDQLSWLYGSGFPKSRNVSKDLDRINGVKRKVVGSYKMPGYGKDNVKHGTQTCNVTKFAILDKAAISDEAKRWDGWGTALKPAQEPIVMARKPFKGNFANNLLEHGVGALNIDACRVAIDAKADASQLRTMKRGQRTGDSNGQTWGLSKTEGDNPSVISKEGRWPANIIHDGSAEVLALFPSGKSGKVHETTSMSGRLGLTGKQEVGYGDESSAARFFYCAKVSKAERKIDEGLINNHPTVKPISLMRYLVRLVTPKGAIVLDPFLGSGTTLVAALLEGCRGIGIEREEDYRKIALARIQRAVSEVSDNSIDELLEYFRELRKSNDSNCTNLNKGQAVLARARSKANR